MAEYQLLVDPDPEAWDRFVGAQGHFLQLAGWGRVKDVTGWSPQRFLVTRGGRPVLGAQVLYRRLLFSPIAYIPRGPVGAEPNAWPFLLEAIRTAAAARGAGFIKLEPVEGWTDLAMRSGFRPAALSIQPRTTAIVDLTLDEPSLLAAMNEKTRRYIRGAQRRGLTIRQGSVEEVETFHRLAEATAERDAFGIHSLDYYRSVLTELGAHAHLYFAEHQGVALASIVVARCGDEAVYLYGASGNDGRTLHPNEPLQWRAMQDARAAGCARYDLWGVPERLAEDPEATGTGGLWGVWGFKRGFGGRLVQRPPSLDLPLSGVRYGLWRLALGSVGRLRGQGVVRS